MRKLFVFQNTNKDYVSELDCAYNKCAGATDRIDLATLTVDMLRRNEYDVVVSNGLSQKWYGVLNELDVVALTIDSIDKYLQWADIVIDHKAENSNKYLTGPEYSICRNADLPFVDIANLIKKLEWDSDFFGFPVALLSSRYLTDKIIKRAHKFIECENIRLVEYLCNCHDALSVRTAEKHGFNFADIRLSFQKKLRKTGEVSMPDGFVFGKAKEEHVPELKKISNGLYVLSRYFFDDHFDKARVNEFYQGWVAKAVRGQYDDECYCLFKNNKPVAFCTIKYALGSASIGLFGLDINYQGKGLGQLLLTKVFNHLIGKQYGMLHVVTQGRNYAAQRLYQRAGFVTRSTELWYHKWMQ
jgi:dTDP-4-amino-4,6-dideoxy-D-galactose acyltransferase